MRKFILTGMAVAMLAVPAAASADVTNNPSAKDGQGWCVVNHMQNGWNGDHDGIGWIRSEQGGKSVSASSGNRVPDLCVTDQGRYGPIND